MRKITRSIALLVGGLLVSASGWAAVPFAPAKAPDGGKFDDATKWYTMKIGNAAYFISGDDSQGFIPLNEVKTKLEDKDLWCFVGNEADGFTIYNKATGEVLCAPANPAASNEGGNSYVLTKKISEAGNLNYLWDIKTSNQLGADTEAYFLQPHGTNYAVNNFGGNGKLAFWTGGKDQGSSIQIEFGSTVITVSNSTGKFTASNDAKTWHANWASNATKPQLQLNSQYNNMKVVGENIAGYTGMYRPQSYKLTTDQNFAVAAYSFTYKNNDKGYNISITAGGKEYTSSDTEQELSVTGLTEQTAEIILNDKDNKGLLFSNFKVTVTRAIAPPYEDGYAKEIFVTDNNQTVPYRIPAIATAKNGNIIAVADHRYSGADIGMVNNGRIDLDGRISKDNGKTWGKVFTIVRGRGGNYASEGKSDFWVGFGDPCIVGDRESNRVLLMSCAGNVSFPGGTRERHQGMARFWSEDGGETWSEPEQFDEQIYSLFDNSKIGTPKSMFIGSGKIFQSSTVKVGDYYRIYVSVLYKDVNNVNKNYVLYSDDFGKNWAVLGGVDVAPIPSGADEPKVEELPDGSILCSSRMGGGRYFNIFTFTDSKKAEGSWGTVATSNSSNNGTVGQSCNGEVMILPATRNSDGKHVFVALQSVPTNPNSRQKVGIYYKELESLTDYITPAKFAANWHAPHLVSKIGSAYSTMTLQNDTTIGFLFEEETYGKTYTIVYKNYNLNYITDAAYSYNPDVDKTTFITAGVAAKTDSLNKYVGTYVGNITAAGYESLKDARDVFNANPSKESYEEFNKKVADVETVKVEAGRKYRLRNYNRVKEGKPLYLVMTGSELTAANLDETSQNQLFDFTIAKDGSWYIHSEANGKYVGRTGQVETKVPVTTEASYAYAVESSLEGLSALVCLNPQTGANAIHLAQDNTRLVPWYASSAASLWYIEPTDITTGIANATQLTDDNSAPETFYDLSGRRVDTPVKGGVYVTSKKRKVILDK